MKDKISASGRCRYCQELIGKRGMTKHLTSHFKKIALENPSENFSYHLLISNGDYFLHLLMNSKATLETLDLFLRRIWLECCGHMSSFFIRKPYNEFDKKTTAVSVFQKTLKLDYHYDFGSTTPLDIVAKGVYEIPIVGIELVSRNEPFLIPCDICQKKPSSAICGIHGHEYRFFCEACCDKHAEECDAFAKYAKMPLVNSPRTGECDYRGGSIDTERDGVNKMGNG